MVAAGVAIQDAQRIVRQLRIGPSDVRVGAGAGAGAKQQLHAGADARSEGGQRDQPGKGGPRPNASTDVGARRVG